MVSTATQTSRTDNMAESVAGFIPRSKGPTKKSRAEEQFNQIQKKNMQALSEKEKVKQEERKKTARLKALRLAKKTTQSHSPNKKWLHHGRGTKLPEVLQ